MTTTEGTRQRDDHRAGAYGFSRRELIILLAVIVVASGVGVARRWQARSAAPVTGWVVEDVTLTDEADAAADRISAARTDTVRIAATPASELLDVNAASAWELERLPGIGPQLAQRIVADRRAKGPFRDLIDFQRVKGIGPKKAAALTGWVRFSSEPADTAGSDDQ